MQDIYDCRTGDFVWNREQLGAGVNILGVEAGGSGVSRSCLGPDDVVDEVVEFPGSSDENST